MVMALVAYFGISQPDEVSLDSDGEVSGVTNAVRELLQGEKFWSHQVKLIRRDIQIEKNRPARLADFNSSMTELLSDIKNFMEDFYTDFPQTRPSLAEQQAQALREKADAIEQAEIDSMLEKFRLKRIENLSKVLHIAESRSEI